MNEVSAIGAGSTAKSAKELQQLGQDQFMKLMLTQLKNQDPLKPLESTEFLSQLAQFSTVTGIQDVKGAVTDMVGSLRASQALQGAGLIGRSVVAVADHANFDGVTSVEGSIDVPEGASAIELTVRDTAVVDQINAHIGQKVVLEYAQHKGLPKCFGDTEHFVTAVRPAPTAGEPDQAAK